MSSNIHQGRDSCGFGMLVNLRGQPNHQLLCSAIEALTNMQHRGGLNADGRTSDGCGILIQIPDRFVRKVAKETLGIDLGQFYGVGQLFLNSDEQVAGEQRSTVEQTMREYGLTPVGWRTVPVCRESCGDLALLAMPKIEQLFFTHSGLPEAELHSLLLRTRLKIEQHLPMHSGFYICSLSTRVICYKALVLPEVFGQFYPDLVDPCLATAICVFHVRYSTNTLPAWPLAQPFRFLAHNGEINSIISNRNWADARINNFCCPQLPDIADLMPVVKSDGSDSSSLDNMLETMIGGGMAPFHALRMLIPPAWENAAHMSEKERAFYRYTAMQMEPWDGPAGIVMTDGRYAICILDRNGLRPARYYLTDDMLIAASEVGVLDLPTADIVTKDRVKPGGILVVDTETGEVMNSAQVVTLLSAEQPYEQWLAAHTRQLPDTGQLVLEPLTRAARSVCHKLFQLNAEESEQVLRPLALGGAEGTGSMGDDTPIVPLSVTVRPIYDMFRQQFAQVTNPPIDSLREKSVMSLKTSLGREHSVFQPRPEYAGHLELVSPILSPADYRQLLEEKGEFKPGVLDCHYDPERQELHSALTELGRQAAALVRGGTVVLVLSDRDFSPDRLPIHSLLAAGAVHSHLVAEDLRCQCNIIVASGSAHNTHHMATLFGFGATAVYPWLGYDAVCQFVDDASQTQLLKLQKNYRTGLEKGLLKIFSKMGISTISAYRGAALFDIVALAHEVMELCFIGIQSRYGGLTFADLEQQIKSLAGAAWDRQVSVSRGGILKFIHGSEYHAFHPDVVQNLHKAVRSGDVDDYRAYARLINERQPAMLRDLLKLVPGEPIDCAEVETVEEILQRFDTAGMSLGALSLEAHETLAIAMNRLGGRSNSGEGGSIQLATEMTAAPKSNRSHRGVLVSLLIIW